VRLDQGSGSMAAVTPFDQKTRGICYSAATNALYDAYRKKEDPQAKLSSAYHGALVSALDFLKSNAEGRPVVNADGGFPLATLNILLKNGGCERSYFDTHRDLGKLEEQFQSFLELKQRYDASKITSRFSWVTPPPYTGLEWREGYERKLYERINGEITLAKRTNATAVQCFQESVQAVSPEVPMVSRLQEQFVSATYEDLMKDLTSITCPSSSTTSSKPAEVTEMKVESPEILKLESEKDRRLKSAYTQVEMQAIYDEYYEKLSKFKQSPAGKDAQKTAMHVFVGDSLVKNGLPVVVSYCATQVLSRFANMGSADECGGHASLVIGRTWDSARGKCRILVRNSWGDDPWLTYRQGVQTEGPNYWVDEDVLYSSKLLEGVSLRTR